MVFLKVGVYRHLEISAPAQNCPDCPSAVLLWLPIKRKHEVWTVEECILRTCQVTYFEYSLIERLFGQITFGCPFPVDVAHPNVSLAERHGGAGEFFKCDWLFLAVSDDRPHFNHVTITICPVAKVNFEVILAVFGSDSPVMDAILLIVGVADIA